MGRRALGEAANWGSKEEGGNGDSTITDCWSLKRRFKEKSTEYEGSLPSLEFRFTVKIQYSSCKYRTHDDRSICQKAPNKRHSGKRHQQKAQWQKAPRKKGPCRKAPGDKSTVQEALIKKAPLQKALIRQREKQNKKIINGEKATVQKR